MLKHAFLTTLGAAAVCSAALLTGCSDKTHTAGDVKDLAQYVDPLIGSGGHGHVFVGANVPFGGVQLGPTNNREGWDWCSGYHISDSSLIGYAHTHLSGTGIGDKGDIHFMPMTGHNGTKIRDYVSTFTRANETAQAGYYALKDDRYRVLTELTATPRTGFHRYTFPATDSARVLINLYKGIGWDAPRELQITAVNETTVEGYRLSRGWAEDDRVYFVAEFSKPFTLTVLADTTVIPAREGRPGRTAVMPNSYGILDFGPLAEGEQILAKVGISGVSIEGAKANFQAEAAGKEFDQVKKEARAAWNDLLAHMHVESNDLRSLRTFYTAVYHASFFPAVFNDVTGEYRGADGKIYKDPDTDIYTIFSLWDTYRAANPLHTITAPEKVGSFVNTFIRIYEQQGKVPVWHLSGNETNTMVGFPSVMVIADAILKDIPGFDVNKAYEAIKAYEMLDERGLKAIREVGYIPADQEDEAVAKALEYCIADWSIAQVAKKLGKTDDYEHFMKRARGYEHYFDKSDCFMKGKLADGSFRTPFNPLYSSHRDDDFCEGNGWQYIWLVPHDFEGLFSLFPSPEAAEAKLDSTFTVPYDGGPNASPDISGLIGQYAHGNEPSHSTIYAYAYLGKQWKTAKMVRQVLDEFYFDGPDGLCGNEDAGQMSAWYVFNAMGFYPANPSNGAFVFGSPLFDKITFPVAGGKKFTMIAENNSPQNVYIQSVTLNGKPHTQAYITYQDIMTGGELKFVMGPQPNESFGASAEDRPRSEMF